MYSPTSFESSSSIPFMFRAFAILSSHSYVWVGKSISIFAFIFVPCFNKGAILIFKFCVTTIIMLLFTITMMNKPPNIKNKAEKGSFGEKKAKMRIFISSHENLLSSKIGEKKQ